VPDLFTDAYEPVIGKGITLIDGEDATVIACGVMLAKAIEASRALAKKGIRIRVVEMHTIKPLDTELVARCARETGAIVTAEEHSVIGGLGGAVAECLSQCAPVPLERVGVNDTFTESGPYNELLDKYGLSTEAVIAALENALARKQANPVNVTSEVI
jgi:transketolase